MGSGPANIGKCDAHLVDAKKSGVSQFFKDLVGRVLALLLPLIHVSVKEDIYE